MAIMVVNLSSEYLPDGSFHVFSPEVPGFHVTEPAESKTNHEILFHETIKPRLAETINRRMNQAKVHKQVWFRDEQIITMHKIIPDEIRRSFDSKHRSVSIPPYLIAEIK